MPSDWLAVLQEWGYTESPVMKRAAERLDKAQQEVRDLVPLLKKIGAKPEQPLTVGIYVTLMTALAEQHSAETQFAMTALLIGLGVRLEDLQKRLTDLEPRNSGPG